MTDSLERRDIKSRLLQILLIVVKEKLESFELIIQLIKSKDVTIFFDSELMISEEIHENW